MTAMEAYDQVTHGGGSDFAEVVAVLEGCGPWCPIGGLAVNCHVEPVYTLDADIVVVAAQLPRIEPELSARGFRLQSFPHSLNARRGDSALSIRFTTDPRYQDFVGTTERREVLGITAPVATLENIVRGKVWAWTGKDRRASKRKKDEPDLLRIAESHPGARHLIPPEITAQLD